MSRSGFFFFSSRRRHTRLQGDWSSDVCSSDLNDCYAVQGYIQAQDRLFQLDFFRRAAEGRAAELVGHALLDQDKQFLALFATRDGERIETKLAAALDVDTKAKVDAFVSGVNAYLT